MFCHVASVKSLKNLLKIPQDAHQTHSTTCHFPFGYERSNKFVFKNLKNKKKEKTVKQQTRERRKAPRRKERKESRKKVK